MGGQHSTEANGRIKSYEQQKYKPVKKSQQGHGSSKSSKKNGRTINNNYMPSKAQLPDSAYNVTYSSDDTVTTHKEVTELRLENDSIQPDTGCRGISPIKVEIMCETESRLNFKICDPNQQRFEVQPEGIQYSPHFKKASHTAYDFEYRERPFSLRVIRKSTGYVLFDSRHKKFTFDDERLHMSTCVHSRYIYGLGEHQKRFLIDTTQPHNYVFWAKGGSAKAHENLYGCHPFFMGLEEDGNAYGVFLLNSCAMEVRITPGDPATLSYTVNGGVLNFYIFTGPTPIEVVQQYQEVIGRPHLPPYWSLGFHLSRWGYQSIDDLQSTVEENRKTGVPYESQWTDIDMMDQSQSWTYRDPQLHAIVKDLHLNGQRYIPIVDPGVSLSHSNNPAYTNGLKLDIFIKNDTGARPLVGKVWPGETVFPDFSHPDVYEYWLNQARSLYDNIPFDGLWLDMNEPESFVHGCAEDCNLTTTHSKDHPSFVPGNLVGNKLYHKTICPSAKQYQGLHFELHNMYGHMEMKVSHRVCQELRGRRSLIISRSTFPGSGKYGGHWTGDNASTFEDLKASISSFSYAALVKSTKLERGQLRIET